MAVEADCECNRKCFLGTQMEYLFSSTRCNIYEIKMNFCHLIYFPPIYSGQLLVSRCLCSDLRELQRTQKNNSRKLHLSMLTETFREIADLEGGDSENERAEEILTVLCTTIMIYF